MFAGTKRGFPPCTAQACIEILNHYNIDVSGKRAVVIGRSLVIGKPVAMMLLQNATVTICHTKTKQLQEEAKRAEILVVSAGRAASSARNTSPRGRRCWTSASTSLPGADERPRICGGQANRRHVHARARQGRNGHHVRLDGACGGGREARSCARV